MNLNEKKCQVCEGGVEPLTKVEAEKLLNKVSNWVLSEDGKSITRHLKFKNYYHTIAFVNAVAFIAHTENHHPDMKVSFNKCEISYTTHAINGLTENDFICAAKVNHLIEH